MLDAETVVEQGFEIAFPDFVLVLHFDFQYFAFLDKGLADVVLTQVYDFKRLVLGDYLSEQEKVFRVETLVSEV
jgi:hypothetical protein